MKHVTPPDPTKRDIFSRVLEHFRAQGHRCVRPNGTGGFQCRYREGDDRCPVGAVIPGNHYVVEMEGYRVRDLLPYFELPKWLAENIDFLEALQTWHDKDRAFDDMMAALPAIARAHGLETVDVQAAIV